jgi:hypothetical protein
MRSFVWLRTSEIRVGIPVTANSLFPFSPFPLFPFFPFAVQRRGLYSKGCEYERQHQAHDLLGLCPMLPPRALLTDRLSVWHSQRET